MGKIIGIDLGTSNSAASAMIGGKPSIIPAAEGTSIAGKAFPSVVGFTKDGQLLVGEPARRQMISNPEGTVLGSKKENGDRISIQRVWKGVYPTTDFRIYFAKNKEGCRGIFG